MLGRTRYRSSTQAQNVQQHLLNDIIPPLQTGKGEGGAGEKEKQSLLRSPNNSITRSWGAHTKSKSPFLEVSCPNAHLRYARVTYDTSTTITLKKALIAMLGYYPKIKYYQRRRTFQGIQYFFSPPLTVVNTWCGLNWVKNLMLLWLCASEADGNASHLCAAGQSQLSRVLMNQFVFPDLCQGLGVVCAGD